MPTVTNTIKRPDGTAATDAIVLVQLVGDNGRPVNGYVTASDYSIHGTYRPTVNSTTAVWSMTLVANSLISPSGTRWKVTENVDGVSSTYYLNVPDGAGPYFVEDILDDVPGSVASSALTTHIAAADPHAAYELEEAATLGRATEGVIYNDVLTPVCADGLGLGVAQAQHSASARYFVIAGDPRQTTNQLGSDSLASYTPGALIKAGSVHVYMPNSIGQWGPTTTSGVVADDDHRYGSPGVAVWDWRIGFNFDTERRRLTQRWYKVPGVEDVLYLQIEFARDASHASAGDATANGLPPRFDVMFESKTWPGVSGQVLDYDANLDGVSLITNDPNGGNGATPAWLFVRCLSDPSSGHYYDDAATPDVNQNFGTGALPTGTDSYTTVSETTFRAHLSVTPAGRRNVYVMRFVVGMGFSLDEAKRRTQFAPNVGPEGTIAHYAQKLAALRRPASLSVDDGRAWDLFLSNVLVNTRTERDYHPERFVYDGNPRRYVMNALGRWNAMWTMDTAMGLTGLAAVDPKLVKDHLDFFFNERMNQSTGFLYYAPDAQGLTMVQNGAFIFARIARRYLEATGDLSFVTALYSKLELMHTWWTATASADYRHPDWPTVRLFTASHENEIQELSPVTSGGNFPSGDDWTTALAYDFAVHMAALAEATGNEGDVVTWEAHATAYRSAIQTYCWDSTQGWFQPTMTEASPDGGVAGDLGRFDAVMTYRAFWHLWAGTATPAQAAIMEAKIMDTAIFKGTYGVRTVDARWGSYNPNDWVNGASRPYHDAALAVGLRRYGFDDSADEILAAWVDRQLTVGTTPEATNPDTGTGGYARYLFTGAMLLEALLAKSAPSLLYGVGTSTVTA